MLNTCNSYNPWKRPKLGHLQAMTHYLLKLNFLPMPANTTLRVSTVMSAVVLSLTNAHTYAQSSAQSPPSMAEAALTANRHETAMDVVLAQTTLISREQITSAGHATLAQLLQRYAGVELRAGGNGGGGIFMRGSNADHTLVLVDGVRLGTRGTLGDAGSASAAIEHIPLDLIERIEVLKGGVSGLYGSDAIGGVVQIFTRGQKSPRLNAELSIGNQSTQAFNGGFSTVEGNTYLALNIGVQKTSAASTVAPGGGSNTNLVLKVTHTLWQGEKISLQAWQSRGKSKANASAEISSAKVESQRNLSGVQFESSNNFMPWWQSKLLAASTRDNPDNPLRVPANFATKQNQLQWLNTLRTPVGTLLLGAEQTRQIITSNASSTNFATPSRTTKSFFGQLLEQNDAQYLQANIRVDKFEGDNNLPAEDKKQTTGQVAYGVKIWPEELVYVSGSRNYKLPSVDALYAFSFSTPMLKPERSTGVEIGYKYELKGNRITPPLSASAALFDNTIEDLITFDTATARLKNTTRAHIRGLELTASGTLANGTWNAVEIRAAITAQQPLDADTKLQLPGRAKLFGSLSVAKKIGKFDGAIDVVAVGKRFDSATQAADSRLGGYATLSARLQYNISKQFSAEIVGSNLTNHSSAVSAGDVTPGRQVMFNVKFSAQ